MGVRCKWCGMAAGVAIAAVGIFAAFRSADAGGAKADGPEAKLRELKIELPAVMKPKNPYAAAVRVGDMVYISGSGPGKIDDKLIVGRLGQDMDIAKGRDAARRVGLQILAVLKEEVGSLDNVERLVKTLGMVQATSDFKDHPKVINGYSELMVEVFGEKAGKGTRSAVGMVSLPDGIPVEIEAIFKLKK